MYDHDKMLYPKTTITDDLQLAISTPGYDLLKHLPGHKRGFYSLHSMWPSLLHYNRVDLPTGYDFYLVSFHMEHIDFDWLRQQQARPIFVLSDMNYYHHDYGLTDVHFLRWLDWHRALEKMQTWFGRLYTKDIKYKASAFCNRLTQSKVIMTTALLEILGRENALTSLSDWLEDKNVHDWQPTNSDRLDSITDVFRKKYLGQQWSMDNFTNDQNFQQHTANPAQMAYQQAALHFTNESFAYSRMHDTILPGPHLTEKTFKCLIGATAFIPVAQFETYATLESLGMRFDYGLDLSFDLDPGNITRLEKLIDVVDEMSQIDVLDLYAASKDSCMHNQDIIFSGDFAKQCQSINENTLSRLISQIG